MGMSDKYILAADGRTPVMIADNSEPGSIDEAALLEWGKWMETANRIVARTEVGDLTVSTVFLALDHDFTGRGPPLLFETMIFGEDPEHPMSESFCDRYSTWTEAEAGHVEAVKIAEERWKIIEAERQEKAALHIMKEREK